jgi:hypothetical protein
VLPRDAARTSIGRWAVCLYYCALAPAGLPAKLAPELEPELPLELEPMPGQCFPIGPPFGGVPVFDPGAGALGLAVAGVGVAVEVLDVDVEVPLLAELLDAAPALEMPANAPPVASAPATIVAPSSFDVFMRSILLG